ncbi:hypothetical protein EN833_23385 [Mesorhizobium sp. M4B.F.Ca.ET.190.01.1.1]|uniref:hypothetical protein n=1 Tax=unclassified Mesorhizobium TaxID=325217 RepID=UPI00109190DB|nr:MULTISPECIES: hypothetical protein [unclassified Mesorhizobium]TGR05417.1 hypothetical protein EN843_23375 [Mesorhizobium sp. M4B.F.Ca.ET.200.01.1.1]TGS15673.1 hypothetical protein EN833_23385 [Mesorhizobium sp. M4B.F.Ca.ET.190.01.1.1]TGT27733.1 hypothetical protein EN815_23360 [Mesorhizobium sp. M4B.F.Ca.ET.172.01.1.1]
MTKNAAISEALAYARERVSFARSTPIDILPGLPPVRFLSKADGRHFVQEMMKNLARADGQFLAEYADYASQGWGIADGAMRELIVETIRGGKPLDPPLSAYSALLASEPPRKKPGKEKADNIFRDIAIALIVDDVSTRFDLSPTSNGKSDNPSACRVVATALDAANIRKGYKLVEGIWARFGKMLRPS